MEENIENTNEQDLANSVTEVSTEITKIQTELDETTDRLKRIMAEFENYKKRSSKERDTLYGSILSDIIVTLLPIIDNLEKAVEANSKDEEYKQGIELVLKQFLDVLGSLGVKKIATVKNTFDPEIHEAVSSITDKNLGEKEISAECRAGYIVGNKVIRHAMVIVAN